MDAVCPRHQPADPRGFTLVELLVSMSVLVLLLLLVAQMTTNATLTTLAAGKHVDADSQARLIFERMDSDFAGIVKRPDANFYFHHQTGNDALYFFSDATGYFSGGDNIGTGTAVPNSLTLVGYRVSDGVSGGVRRELERLGRGLHWYDASASTPPIGMVYLPTVIKTAFAQVLADPYNNSSYLQTSEDASYVPQWDVIGDQIVRLEFCYLLKDGTLTDAPVSMPSGTKNNVAGSPPTANDDQNSGYTAGSRWYDNQAEIGYVCVNPSKGAALWNPLGTDDIRAVIVAIAVLDARSRLLVSQQTLKNVSGALPDFDATSVDPNTGKPVLMAVAWKKVVDAPGFASTTGLPSVALGGLRIYQRFFTLN